MSSIVNIFDNLLKYNDKNVFIIMDIHNNIWFKIKDVLKLLDYTGSNKFTRIKGVNDENICKMKYIYPLKKLYYFLLKIDIINAIYVRNYIYIFEHSKWTFLIFIIYL